MASKWMKNKEELFKQFKDEVNKEVTTNTRNDMVWKTPERGTTENPKTYQLRLLMDPNDNFYKSYHYHMYLVTTMHHIILKLIMQKKIRNRLLKIR